VFSLQRDSGGVGADAGGSDGGLKVRRGAAGEARRADVSKSGRAARSLRS